MDHNQIISLTLDPPLNCITSLKSPILEFNALVTTSTPDYELIKSLQLELWWNGNSSDWNATSFSLYETEPLVCSEDSLQLGTSYRYKLQFVPPKSSKWIEFTARYRLNNNSDYVWCGSFGRNGRILLRCDTVLPSLDQTTLFSDTSEDIQIEEMASQVPGGRIWKYSGTIAPTDNKEKSVALGRPIDMQQYLALVRLQVNWLGPRHGREHFEIDRPAAIVLFQRTDGINVAVLPFSNMKVSFLVTLF